MISLPGAVHDEDRNRCPAALRKVGDSGGTRINFRIEPKTPSLLVLRDRNFSFGTCRNPLL